MILYIVTDAAQAGDISAVLRRAPVGRWNAKGYPCLSACATDWQAIVEHVITVPVLKRPRKLAITAIQVPAGSLTEISLYQLFPGWDSWPRPLAARKFGMDLLMKCETLLLVFPSATGKKNATTYLVNAKHPLMKDVKVLWTEPFNWDPVKLKKH